MPVTDQQYTAWLSDDKAARCILVEVVVRISGIETTLYLSTMPYESGGQVYKPVVVGNSVQITERLSLTGDSTLNFGDIEIVNGTNKDGTGKLDNWLSTSHIWTNRSCNAYIGDVNWDRADFRPIFIGVTEDIDSRDNTRLNIKIRDKLERLNTPVTEEKLGGVTPNKNRLKPLCFGRCFNVSPLLVNTSTLEQMVHNGQIEDIVEVRSNGAPAGVSKDLANGEFTPTVNPQGTKVTADVQGAKPSGVYLETIVDIIQHLVTNYGEPNTRFSAGDLDSTNLSAFDTAHPDLVGVYLPNRANLLSVCNDLAASVGAQMVMSREGELQLHQITLPPAGTPTEIRAKDMLDGTLHISDRPLVQGAISLRFAKNYSVQEDLDTRIPQDDKDDFEQEWLTVTSENATVKSNYRLDAEPEPIETNLVVESEAQTECDRLLSLWETQRHVYTFDARPWLLELRIGNPVTIYHPRFGLSGGKTGMVIGMSMNWFNTIVKVDVLA